MFVCDTGVGLKYRLVRVRVLVVIIDRDDERSSNK